MYSNIAKATMNISAVPDSSPSAIATILIQFKLAGHTTVAEVDKVITTVITVDVEWIMIKPSNNNTNEEVLTFQMNSCKSNH
jgi:hypothetical protein